MRVLKYYVENKALFETIIYSYSEISEWPHLLIWPQQNKSSQNHLDIPWEMLIMPINVPNSNKMMYQQPYQALVPEWHENLEWNLPLSEWPGITSGWNKIHCPCCLSTLSGMMAWVKIVTFMENSGMYLLIHALTSMAVYLKCHWSYDMDVEVYPT